MKPGQASRRTLGLALIWGLAEATVFFIVPDVLLTWVALSDRTRALWSCIAVTFGALIGGIIMYQWGAANYASACRVLDAVPAISPIMIESVHEQITGQGPQAMFFGPLTGTPYKIFAVAAGNSGQSLWLLLLISIPARLLRFVILTLFAAGASRVLSSRISIRSMQAIHVSCWVLFYIAFFWLMPN